VCSEVPLSTVIARLEALLPGLSASAAASAEQRRVRHKEYGSRLRPAQPRPGETVNVDHLVAFAEKHGGRVTARQFGDDVEFEDLAPHLRILAGADVLVVHDALDCTRRRHDHADRRWGSDRRSNDDDDDRRRVDHDETAPAPAAATSSRSPTLPCARRSAPRSRSRRARSPARRWRP
jgi:hypothetical protein